MTPDQIATSTLRFQEIQTWITGFAIFVGPLVGVLFTLWFQSRKEKNDAKHQLFLALVAERKALFVTPKVAQELNKIEVAFSIAQRSRLVGTSTTHCCIKLPENRERTSGLSY